MRLYPKRLRNIDDLEKEKALLIRKSEELEKEDILSVEGLLGGKKKGEGGSLLDLLPISNPLVGQLLKMIQRRFNSYRSKKDDRPKIANVPVATTEERPRKSKIKAIAIEFIGGYLKWKAIELSFKGIRYLIKSAREKKEQRP